MSVFRRDAQPSAWCELTAFDIIDLAVDGTVAHERRAPKERLIVSSGTAQLLLAGASLVLKENQFVDCVAARWTLRGAAPNTQVVRLSGRWGSELGGCGVFRAANVANPSDRGDPVDYPKTTLVDSHYHDCDEYWIVLEGAGTVVVGGRMSKVSAGDCVCIGMGHHHDLPTVDSPVKAAFFETTLEGAQRVGHLWNHTHGLARPQPERI